MRQGARSNEYPSRQLSSVAASGVQYHKPCVDISFVPGPRGDGVSLRVRCTPTPRGEGLVGMELACRELRSGWPAKGWWLESMQVLCQGQGAEGSNPPGSAPRGNREGEALDP